MSLLFLLRHAKAAWAQPGGKDFDRKLEESGKADAFAAAAAMAVNGWFPEKILCSPAVRTRQTLAEVLPPLGMTMDAVTFTDALFHTDAAGYLDAIRSFSGAKSLLVIGHNPMIEDVALALAGSGPSDSLGALAGGFPTAGLAVLRFDGPLSDSAPGLGALEAFIVPSR